VQDLDTAFAVIRNALKSGGSLIVADDVPYAVAVHETPSSGAGFEHYRNLDAASAAALLKDVGFDVLRELPVTAQTEHRWVVFARKPGGEPAVKAKTAPAAAPKKMKKPAHKPAKKPARKSLKKPAKKPVKRPVRKARPPARRRTPSKPARRPARRKR